MQNLGGEEVAVGESQLDHFIDEKCSMLSKKGVSKEGSVHLAQWMKGQFNNKESIREEFDDEEGNQDWSAEEVAKRSKELRLMHEVKKIEENPSEDEHAAESTSKSTSDSQVSFFYWKFAKLFADLRLFKLYSILCITTF